jgi:SPP1 family phage portal protein
MTLEEILKQEKVEDIRTKLCVGEADDVIKTYINQYECKHTILKRKDRLVGPTGSKKRVITAKLVVPFQKKIVRAAVSFLFGEPIKYNLEEGKSKPWLLRAFKASKERRAYDAITKVLDDNNMKYVDKEIARRTMIETKVAEMWFPVKNGNGQWEIKVLLFHRDNGDEVYAHYDDFGNVDAIIRECVVKDENDKEHDRLEIYTATETRKYTKDGSKWEEDIKPNTIGMILGVFYSMDKPEWDDVQSEIDRFEMMISKEADMNDYFAAPALMIKGKLENPPDKDTVGKMFQFKASKGVDGKTEYGDMKYLEWNFYPESLANEKQTLKDIIYGMTDTPDLSFNNLKGIGNISARAMKIMLLSSILKANDHQEVFGAGIERRLEVLKALIGMTDVSVRKAMEEIDISVKFGTVVPRDVVEMIEALTVARGGEPVISRLTALKNNPLVEDAQEEYEIMEYEEERIAGEVGGGAGEITGEEEEEEEGESEVV